jgi:hypothetical protein
MLYFSADMAEAMACVLPVDEREVAREITRLASHINAANVRRILPPPRPLPVPQGGV